MGAKKPQGWFSRQRIEMQVAIIVFVGGIIAAIITACAMIASAILPILASDHVSPSSNSILTNTPITIATFQIPPTAVTTPSFTSMPSVTATYTPTASNTASLTSSMQPNSALNPSTLTDIYVQTQISKMTTALAVTYGIN